MKFVFIGGPQPAEGDEVPTNVPRECFAFGLNWVQGETVDVTPDKFKTQDAYQNTIMRLQNNRFFQPVTVEDAVFEEVVPDRPVKGKKSKAVAAPADEPEAA